jgi:hypothetical protein
MRYLAPAVPFLFPPTAALLARFRPAAAYLVATFSVASSWALAMYRDVESGFGVLRPILQTFVGGFQLPSLRSLSYLETLTPLFPSGVSPLPLFALTAVLLYLIWSPLLDRSRDSRRAVRQ